VAFLIILLKSNLLISKTPVSIKNQEEFVETGGIRGFC